MYTEAECVYFLLLLGCDACGGHYESKTGGEIKALPSAPAQPFCTWLLELEEPVDEQIVLTFSVLKYFYVDHFIFYMCRMLYLMETVQKTLLKLEILYSYLKKVQNIVKTITQKIH